MKRLGKTRIQPQAYAMDPQTESSDDASRLDTPSAPKATAEWVLGNPCELPAHVGRQASRDNELPLPNGPSPASICFPDGSMSRRHHANLSTRNGVPLLWRSASTDAHRKSCRQRPPVSNRRRAKPRQLRIKSTLPMEVARRNQRPLQRRGLAGRMRHHHMPDLHVDLPGIASRRG